jgi:hypothetical protein
MDAFVAAVHVLGFVTLSQSDRNRRAEGNAGHYDASYGGFVAEMSRRKAILAYLRSVSCPDKISGTAFAPFRISAF